MSRFRTLTSRLVLTTVVLVAVVSVLIGTATALAMRAYLTDHLGRLDRAVQSLTAGSYRRKAAVVGELFDQIALHFRQVKAEKQVRSEFLPDRTEFKVSVKDVTSPQNFRRFRGPAPTRMLPRPGFRKKIRSC